jgi:hypothetical protein
LGMTISGVIRSFINITSQKLCHPLHAA